MVLLSSRLQLHLREAGLGPSGPTAPRILTSVPILAQRADVLELPKAVLKPKPFCFPICARAMTKAEQKKAVQFTRMCKFWRTNECKMGVDCTFAHSTSELRPSPKSCFDFVKNGYCARGHSCRFVHHVVESTEPGFTYMQHSNFPAFQAQEDALLAACMMPTYPQNGPMSPMGVAEAQQFRPSRTFAGQPAQSRDPGPAAVSPPGLDQILSS